MSWSPSATYSPSTLGGPISRTSSNDVATPLRLGHVSGSSAWNRRVSGRVWRHTWDESMPKHRRFPRVASGASRRRRNARNLWMRVLVAIWLRSQLLAPAALKHVGHDQQRQHNGQHDDDR